METALKTVLISLAAIALSATAASATCTAPLGRYAGATAGITYDTKTKQPASFQNRQFFLLFNSDGSGTVQIAMTPGSDPAINGSFPARNVTGHTWNGTTCSGKVTSTVTVSGLSKKVTLAYVVVDSGNKALLSDATSGTPSEVYPYVITVEKQ